MIGWKQLAMDVHDKLALAVDDKSVEAYITALRNMKSEIDKELERLNHNNEVEPPVEKVAGHVSESWRMGV